MFDLFQCGSSARIRLEYLFKQLKRWIAYVNPRHLVYVSASDPRGKMRAHH